MRAFLISYCPNPNPDPNITQCAKNNSGIKTLTYAPHILRVVSNATLIGFHMTQTLRCVQKIIFTRLETKTYPPSLLNL